MKVAAIIVTRGDHEHDLRTRVIPSLPQEWEVVVWDNSREEDLSVYGRYAAIARTDADLIYVQDDDCIVSDPRAIVDEWLACRSAKQGAEATRLEDRHVVCNMPPNFRHEFYEEHGLVGFGAAFHRDAPQEAFGRFFAAWAPGDEASAMFNRTCDIVFTGLTPRVLVDVPKDDLPYAFDWTRMWRQPKHQYERTQMLDLVRKVRDGNGRWPDDYRGFGSNVRPRKQP